MNTYWLWAVVGLCVLTIAYVAWNYFRIKKMGEGTDRMVELSGIIRSGANVFIKKEFTTIGIVVLVVAVLFSLFIEKISGLTYIFGALMSTFVCVMGIGTVRLDHDQVYPAQSRGIGRDCTGHHLPAGTSSCAGTRGQYT